MAKTFRLNIITGEKKIYEGDIRSLVAPGGLGYLGILADHAPLLTTLVPGKITFKDAAGKTEALDSSTNSFLQVLRNKATILVE